ncbi:MAG: HAMP domain-containing histidine kinase [Clostridiales bacterium]|nr:HAMP domain-containing histidine kinase [Clostridiales bacterium]
MKLFFSYLFFHRKSLVLFGIAGVIFTVVFVLYSLPAEPLLYALLLAFVFTLPVMLIDFSNYRDEHMLLENLKRLITQDISLLPEPKTVPQRDYDALLRLLDSEKVIAQSEKSRAIRDMSEYYTLWAHQIKTPIAAMRLILQSAPETRENSELEEQLFKIEQYVEMVLTYVRSEDSGGDYVIRSVNVDDAVRTAVRKYRKSFIRKHITLVFDETGITAVSDEKWLTFSIEQILSNALKYTPADGTIHIFSPCANALCISDTGIGIAPEDLPRICEKGFTGYNGRADKKSTGIGLYLTKRVLSRLSHGLEISSRIGEGTSVTVHFPEPGARYE